ncbi:MAG: methyltransferase domain-containing protein, partial [Acidobacteriota bacterium]
EEQEALRAQARKIAAHGETLGRQEADLQRQDVTLRQQAIAMGEAQGRVAAQQEALHEQAAQLQTLRVLVERLQDAARAGEKTWQQASQDLAARQQAAIEATQAALEQIRQRLGVPGVQPSGLDRFYRDLEERFRGPFDLIKERQKRYLPVVARARAGSTSRPVLDLGCGRGEWLQILAENGLVARGIDRNKAVLASCRQLGLAVEAVDLFDYLEKLPDASVGAVTAFHVLEHLPFEQIMQLLHETARVLAAGGVGIFETPNPANLGVASYSFHFDPSHLTVLPGPLLQFMAEHQGLSHIEVEEIHPVARPDSGGPVHRLVSGPQDQVVIGWSERPEPR